MISLAEEFMAPLWSYCAVRWAARTTALIALLVAGSSVQAQAFCKWKKVGSQCVLCNNKWSQAHTKTSTNCIACSALCLTFGAQTSQQRLNQVLDTLDSAVLLQQPDGGQAVLQVTDQAPAERQRPAANLDQPTLLQIARVNPDAAFLLSVYLRDQEQGSPAMLTLTRGESTTSRPPTIETVTASFATHSSEDERNAALEVTVAPPRPGQFLVTKWFAAPAKAGNGFDVRFESAWHTESQPDVPGERAFPTIVLHLSKTLPRRLHGWSVAD
jgi:hypothetical protein